MADNSVLSTGLIAGGLALGLYLTHVYRKYQQHLHIVGNTPGPRTLFSILRALTHVLPYWKLSWTTPGWRVSVNNLWFQKHGYKLFEQYGQDVIAGISLDSKPPIFIVGDADVTQEIMGNRSRFPKPIKAYEILNVYGSNVVIVEGNSWRIHRKITAPTFSENNNKLVCKVTVDVVEGLFELWKGRDVVEIQNVVDITVALALKVISGAGFGMHIPWTDTEIPKGHEMSFKDAIEVASSGIFAKLMIPRRLMGLSQKTARIRLGFDELGTYMTEMIEERTQSKGEHNDLFSNLIAANENDDEGLKLSKDELMGNIFIFLIAGHETTAHALAFSLALLALHQDIQESLYNHIKSNFPDPSVPFTFKDVNRLTYTNAVFYESLRMFPMTPTLPKLSTESTVLNTRNNKGETVPVFIPKGSRVNINIGAIHRNTKYWEDPDTFKPERFLGEWPRQAFLPFATGARSCIGRRFAEVEAVIALSMLVQRYNIETKDAFPGETFEAKYSRVLANHQFITPTPDCIPITLTLRK